MLTDFQKTKIGRMFQVYDADENGYIERHDFEMLVERLANMKGFEKDTEEYTNLESNILGGDWQSLRQLADVDHDGQISLTEYYVVMHKLITGMPKRVTAAGFAQRIFDWADGDNDNEINVSEFQDFIAHYGVEADEAAEVFARLDRDGDGHWTLSECIEDVQDFLFSENVDAPGNWLLGKL